MNPVELTRALIRFPSVTPDDAGALDFIAGILKEAGFTTRRVERGGVGNLYARIGDGKPVLGFNGHVDVVPPGDMALWTHEPFGGEIKGGKLYGRGACDMKSGLAAFISSAVEFTRTPFPGSIILLITADEEGAAEHGTRALLDDLLANGEQMDHCIVGEPTCPNHMGEMIKIGRRGSLSATISAKGKQGHVAYPERASNPLPLLLDFLHELAHWQLDEGYQSFDPSNLEIVSVDTGNPAINVIPASAKARLNIRFNPSHSAASLVEALDEMIFARNQATKGVTLQAEYKISGEAFLTEEGDFTRLVAAAGERVTGHAPTLSSTGGTSDARFIKDHCPVVECGLVGRSLHEIDEYVETEHIEMLAKIYLHIMEEYFK